MTRRHYSNLAAPATLAGNLTDSATTTTVSPSLSGYPTSYPYTVALERGTNNEELILVTNTSGVMVTMTRAYGGTTAKAHDVGSAFEHVVDATDADEANSHVNAASGVHSVVGALVGTTDSQTLTNKTISSSTLLATSTDVAVKGKAASTGTAALIQCVDSAGSSTLHQVARDGSTLVTTDDNTKDVLTVKGASSQSGKMVEVQNSSATELFAVDSAGRLIHKPSSLTSTLAYKLVPPDSSTHSAYVIRDTTDAADQFVLDTSGAITTASTAYFRGFFSNDVLRYPLDGSSFKVDSSGNVTLAGNVVATGTLKGSNGAGKVALTRVTSGSQSTTGGAEVFWTAMQTAVSVVSGRKYKVTLTIQLDSVTVSTPVVVAIRNSGSGSAPTTSSVVVGVWQSTPQTFAEDKSWMATFTAGGTGTNTLGVSVARLSGSGEVSVSPPTVAAELLVEDIGT